MPRRPRIQLGYDSRLPDPLLSTGADSEDEVLLSKNKTMSVSSRRARTRNLRDKKRKNVPVKKAAAVLPAAKRKIVNKAKALREVRFEDCEPGLEVESSTDEASSSENDDFPMEISDTVSDNLLSETDSDEPIVQPTRRVPKKQKTDKGNRCNVSMFDIQNALTKERKKAESARRGVKRKRRTVARSWAPSLHPEGSRFTSEDLHRHKRFVREYGNSGLASDYELKNFHALEARQHLEAQRRNVTAVPQIKQSLASVPLSEVAPQMLWRAKHEVSYKSLQRTRRIEALAPWDPSAEPVAVPTQLNLAPCENLDERTGKRIRNKEDFITMMFREAWGAVPEARDKHRADKRLPNFSTSFERKFLRMYELNSKAPQKDLFRMDNCKGVRQVLQHCWGLQFRLAEMQRAQWSLTQKALSDLLSLPDEAVGDWRERLGDILDVDKSSTGVAWYTQERISELVEQSYCPQGVDWNKNTDSRVDFLTGQLRHTWDFMTKKERSVRKNTFQKNPVDPLTSELHTKLRNLTRKENVTAKVSDTAKETECDALVKGVSKSLLASQFHLN